MKRPLAVLAATALASTLALTPALTANAAEAPTPSPSATTAPPRTYPGMPDPPLAPAPRLPETTATWVNGTLTVVYSRTASFHEGVSDSSTFLKIDGKFVDSVSDSDFDPAGVTVYPVLDRGVETHAVVVRRAASAGPARVEITTWDEVESGYNYSYPTTWYSASVQQQVVEPKKGQVTAATLLGKLKVAKESRKSSYARSKFTLWVDANHDGETTHAEVLKAESKKRVTENTRHTVKTGRWVSAYDGKTFTAASKLSIDHLVPLQEAWASGAATWSTKKRTAYANDLGYGASLIAVSKRADRAKRDKEPNAYLPAKTSYRCTYVKDYVAVKYRWRLKVDPTEKAALKADLAEYCVNPYVAKPRKPNLAALVGKPKPKHHSGGSGSGGSGGGSTSGLDTRYPTCTELLKHPNHAPYQRGVDPEYDWYQDRDGDGLVCE